MSNPIEQLEGAELDAAVARALGMDADAGAGGFTPSTRWHDGGPVIERERISVFQVGGEQGYWMAGFNPQVDHGSQCESGWLELPSIEVDYEQSGPTPLVAAMRAFVAAASGKDGS